MAARDLKVGDLLGSGRVVENVRISGDDVTVTSRKPGSAVSHQQHWSTSTPIQIILKPAFR